MTQDPPRMISVLSSTNGYAAGQLLGLFQDKHAAIEAINGRE